MKKKDSVIGGERVIGTDRVLIDVVESVQTVSLSSRSKTQGFR